MFDMSWGEMMVIGTVALLVIGPKELPKALRTVGRMTAKVRSMAGEFHTQFNDAMREAELDEVRKQFQGVQQAASFNPVQTFRDEIKGAIEAPAGTAAPAAETPGATVAAAAAEARGEAGPAVPVEPAVALSIPSVPPVVHPAHSIAASIESEAAARSAAKPEGVKE